MEQSRWIHCMTESVDPDIITALSVELRSISFDIWMVAPVICRMRTPSSTAFNKPHSSDISSLAYRSSCAAIRSSIQIAIHQYIYSINISLCLFTNPSSVYMGHSQKCYKLLSCVLLDDFCP